MRCRDDDNVAVRRINTEYLRLINRFCKEDNDIATCRKKLVHEVFRHEWFIALFTEEEGHFFLNLPLFNKPFFKEALRQFYVEAHDSLSRFGFFGYYYVKDIEQWIEEISTPPSLHCDEEDDDDYDEDYEPVITDTESMLRDNITANFPFGIIPVGSESVYTHGQYVVIEGRYTMTRNVVFQCEEEELCARFHFNVIDRGASFVPMSYTESHGMYILGMRDDLVPVSPFADLYRQKQLIRESETTLFDANSLNVYPESLIIDNPHKDAVLDDVADDTLYSIDNLLCAKQVDNIQREAMGMQNTRYQRDRLAMKRTVDFSRGRCGGGGGNQQLSSKASSVIWDHKLDNNRPSAFEAMRAIPRSVTVVGGKIGQPVVNVEKRIQKYEEDVCNVMNIPFVFFRPHSAMMIQDKQSRTASLGGKTSHNDAFQKELEKEVHEQHLLFDELFREMYAVTFANLDSQIFHPTLLRTITPGIRFDHTLVKSDEAILNLVEFAKAGFVPIDEVRRLVHKNYNIPLPMELDVQYGDEVTPIIKDEDL